MRTTMLCSALLLALPAGCALQPQAQPPWSIAPVVSVRHGGAGAQAHYQTGRYFQGQRRLDQAEAAFRRAIELDAQHSEAHNA